MEMQAQNFAIKCIKFFILQVFIIAYQQVNAQVKQNLISDEIEKEIHKRVDMSFSFTWGLMFDKQQQPLSHRFFSIAFDVDKNGLYTNLVASNHLDTAIFPKSIEQMKNRLPKDLFKKAGIKNTKVIFPVFVFIVPRESDSLSYEKPYLTPIEEIWQFKKGSNTLQNVTLFPPIIYRIPYSKPDDYILGQPREEFEKEEREKKLLKLPSLKKK